MGEDLEANILDFLSRWSISDEKPIEIKIDEIVKLIKDDTKKPKIIIFSGAGMSTSAGIPDFRSKDGLYALIKSDMKLDNPADIFTIDFFKKNPTPFFSVAKMFLTNKYKPTLSHCFLKLLQDKGLLLKNFTQNIDGLDKKIGIEDEKNIECHGHFRVGHCVRCSKQISFDDMKKQLDETSKIKCQNSECGGLSKPDIVFFGESLPSKVFDNIEIIEEADLAIVIGTSMKVSPFNFFIHKTKPETPILLLNRESVDGIGLDKRKLCFMEGNCDDSVKKICEKLGWTKEVEELFKTSN